MVTWRTHAQTTRHTLVMRCQTQWSGTRNAQPLRFTREKSACSRCDFCPQDRRYERGSLACASRRETKRFFDFLIFLGGPIWQTPPCPAMCDRPRSTCVAPSQHRLLEMYRRVLLKPGCRGPHRPRQQQCRAPRWRRRPGQPSRRRCRGRRCRGSRGGHQRRRCGPWRGGGRGAARPWG